MRMQELILQYNMQLWLAVMNYFLGDNSRFREHSCVILMCDNTCKYRDEKNSLQLVQLLNNLLFESKIFNLFVTILAGGEKEVAKRKPDDN